MTLAGADFHAAVSSYLSTLPPGHIQHAAIAIANPVEGDQVRMTNYHWQFSIEEMRQRLHFAHLVIVNDFTALAMGVPSLLPHQRRQIGGGTSVSGSVIGLIGAGSGLGVSGLIPTRDGWIALGTEGGHTSFAPVDEREIAILRYAWRHYRHVSFERLVSGPGLELIYRALCEERGRDAVPLASPEITRRALEHRDDVCVAALDAFCAMLGTAAANLAVTQGAFGGIYIGGGIVPRLGSFFDQSAFRQRFEDNGRFSQYLRSIPTYIITAEDATLTGVSVILAAQMRGLDASQDAVALLNQIQRLHDSLSPAEQRVAHYVLGHSRDVLNEPIAQIARAADVSQPTVIRFCRSLGCDGLSDFKLRLASSLNSTIPLTHTQVTGEDSMLELGVKVLSNTASSILQVREHLNRETIDRAVRQIASAQRVEFYATGYYSPVADDAQLKFLRIGIPAATYTTARLQTMAAQVLQPGVVVVLISSTGQIEELLHVADAARARGASVIAITTSQSALARKADLTLVVNHGEDITTQLPMVSRVLHLLMIDILVVGVTMQRRLPPLPQTPPSHDMSTGTGMSQAGTSTAIPLAYLTSHSR